MYSLLQKRMIAKVAGKDEVVLTMEEIESTLAHIKELDLQIVKYMEYVPADVLTVETEEMFGPKPDDSTRRCVHCDQYPDGAVACCNKWDGSFYWNDV